MLKSSSNLIHTAKTWSLVSYIAEGFKSLSDTGFGNIWLGKICIYHLDITKKKNILVHNQNGRYGRHGVQYDDIAILLKFNYVFCCSIHCSYSFTLSKPAVVSSWDFVLSSLIALFFWSVLHEVEAGAWFMFFSYTLAYLEKMMIKSWKWMNMMDGDRVS